ncbi:MAG: hypothetical protein JW910_11245, partial [Anaerolineae bacterium]|nr:hypothetical protein [Anaerolineae bacterium]
ISSNFFDADFDTDGDGNWTILGLPPGDYTISANAPGYAGEFYDGANGTPDWQSALPVTVSLGATVSGIDIPLGLGGTISGTVTDQNTGLPIADLLVVAAGYGGTCTDGSGNYVLDSLPRDVALTVRTMGSFNPCGGPDNYASEWWQEANNSAAATPITLTDANPDAAGIDFTLEEGGFISGTVYNADGSAPLENLHVYVEGMDVGACTDANGDYTLDVVPYDTPVLVSSGGTDNFCGGSENYLREWWQESDTAAGATPVTVTAATPNVTGIDFTLVLDSEVLFPGYYEETDPALVYNAQWKFKAKAAASGGTAAKAKSGALVEFWFSGDVLVILRHIGPLDGDMQVCIDGTCRTVSNYAAIGEWQVPVAFGPYLGGVHMVSISRPADQPRFWFDALEVVSLDSPLTAGVMVQETDPAFLYVNDWQYKAKAAAQGGGVNKAKSVDSSVFFSFEGTEFTLYRRVGPLDGNMRVCIDGTCQNVSNYNAVKLWGQPVTFSGLSAGPHVVGVHRIPGNKLFFDAVWVGPGAPVGEVNPTVTPRPTEPGDDPIVVDPPVMWSTEEPPSDRPTEPPPTATPTPNRPGVDTGAHN